MRPKKSAQSDAGLGVHPPLRGAQSLPPDAPWGPRPLGANFGGPEHPSAPQRRALEARKKKAVTFTFPGAACLHPGRPGMPQCRRGRTAGRGAHLVGRQALGPSFCRLQGSARMTTLGEPQVRLSTLEIGWHNHHVPWAEGVSTPCSGRWEIPQSVPTVPPSGCLSPSGRRVSLRVQPPPSLQPPLVVQDRWTPLANTLGERFLGLRCPKRRQKGRSLTLQGAGAPGIPDLPQVLAQAK